MWEQKLEASTRARTLDLKAKGSGIKAKFRGSIPLWTRDLIHEMAPNRPETDRKHKKANKGLKVSDIY